MNRFYNFYQIVVSKAKERSALAAAFLVTSIILKGVELIIVFYSHYFKNETKLLFFGIINEIVFSSFVFIILIMISPLFHISILRKVVYGMLASILTLQLISGFYFIITLEPISSTLFKFSLQEMKFIISNFAVFKWYYSLIFLPSLLFYFLVKYFKRIEFSNKVCLAMLFPFITFYPVAIWNGDHLDYLEQLLAKNRSIHFIGSVYNYMQPEAKSNIDEAVRIFQKTNKERYYLGVEYPLAYRKEKKNPLGPFFNLKETPPNIVFIIVESLSSPYSGKHARDISFTPFLDSLSKHSLVFHNFLSTADRTFAVLPSSLASLPHGDKGFNDMKYNMPKHYSLPQFLFKNGYKDAFFYGGYSRFDNMDIFMRREGFNNIFDRKEYNYEGTKYRTSIDSVPFGINDKELFSNSFDLFKTLNTDDPYFHVYLTLSMHFPFIIENQKSYIEKVKAIVATKPNLANEKKEMFTTYKEIFSTFLYTDDAIKMFFDNYKKQKSYENTIFVIFGDHMMGDLPQENQIEKFRTPFIIYSPLLTRTKDIYAVNTQLDIAPSILALIENKYKFNSEDTVHWLGSHFDTAQTFQNKRALLFMQNDRETNHFLNQDKFLSKKQLYTFDSFFNLEKIPRGDSIKEKKAFSDIHKYAVLMDKIIPSQNKEVKLFLESQAPLVEFGSEDEYIPLINHKLKEGYTNLSIELDIDFIEGITKKNSDVQPLLIFCISSMTDSGKVNKYWVKSELKRLLLEKDKIENLTTRQMIYSGPDFNINPGDEIGVYFWNIKKSDQVFKIKKNLIKLTAE